MKLTWSERLALRALRFVPRAVADAPERVLINAACVLIGLSGVFTPTQPHTLMATWPHWFAVEWSAGMIVGGVAALVGVSSRQWPLERLGVVLIGICAFVCTISLLLLFWPRGIFTALIFLGIAVAKAVRFIVSSAARAQILRNPRPPGADPEDR